MQNLKIQGLSQSATDRIKSAVILLSAIFGCTAMGHTHISLLLIAGGLKCYQELMKLQKWQIPSNCYSIAFDMVLPVLFYTLILPRTLLRSLEIVNYKLTCGLLGLLCLVIFTLSLQKGYYKQQFKRLGWQICALVIPGSSACLASYYIFQGMFWMVVAHGAVCVNDVMAYVFGKSFGKTPLIKLSPSKTVEGFIGGGVSTILFVFIVAQYFQDHQSMICQQTSLTFQMFSELNCETPKIFQQHERELYGINLVCSDAQIHAAVIALCASIIAPFGGFLASGLKRALQIKDFSDSIPGHGGFADRFDCHFIISFFTYMYLTQVVYKSNHSAEKIWSYVNDLSEADKRMLYDKLQQQLF